MGIHYVAQSVSELQFSVVRRRLSPVRFQILKSHIVEQDSYRAELWIIGSSHALNLQTSHGWLAEVLTCGQTTAPSEESLCRKQGAANWAWEHHGQDIFYKVGMTTASFTEHAFLREQTRVLKQLSPTRLLFHFPRADSLIASPITLIDVTRSTPDCLEIQTLHSYVEALTMVWTHSLFQIRV